MIVDTHAHIIVPEMTRSAASGEAWRPLVAWENGKQVVEYGGKRITSAIREFVHIESILENQSSAGVDHALLCPWVSLLRYESEPDEGLRISRIQNEALARLAQAHPSQVSALGTVPLQDPELAARALEDLVKMPGLHGVEVAASVDRKSVV